MTWYTKTAKLTQDDPGVDAVQVENPGAGDLGSVLHVLLQALPVDLQRVLVRKTTDRVDVDGGFGLRFAHIERLFPHKFEHPVPSHYLLWCKKS